MRAFEKNLLVPGFCASEFIVGPNEPHFWNDVAITMDVFSAAATLQAKPPVASSRWPANSRGDKERAVVKWKCLSMFMSHKLYPLPPPQISPHRRAGVFNLGWDFEANMGNFAHH